MNQKMLAIPLFVCGFIICIPVIGLVEAENSQILAKENSWIRFDGQENDEYSIKLLSSSKSINLYIIKWTDFQGNWKDEAGINWKQENINEGSWIWKQPSDEEWVIIIENVHNEEVNVDIKVTRTQQVKESRSCISAFLIAIICSSVIISSLIYRRAAKNR